MGSRARAQAASQCAERVKGVDFMPQWGYVSVY